MNRNFLVFLSITCIFLVFTFVSCASSSCKDCNEPTCSSHQERSGLSSSTTCELHRKGNEDGEEISESKTDPEPVKSTNADAKVDGDLSPINPPIK